jgi:hypothetical protein
MNSKIMKLLIEVCNFRIILKKQLRKALQKNIQNILSFIVLVQKAFISISLPIIYNMQLK